MYDLETHNTNKARPYIMTFLRLSKLAGKYNRDLTTYEKEKCKKDTLGLDGDNFVNIASDCLLKFKREHRKTINIEFVEKQIKLHAHNRSGFYTWIIINNFPCDKHIVDIIKTGKRVNSMRIFNDYISNNTKQILSISIF